MSPENTLLLDHGGVPPFKDKRKPLQHDNNK